MSSVVETLIPWIGEVPTDWDIKPLFSVATENKNKNKERNENVLSLSYGRIIRRDLSKNFGLLPENFDGYQVVETGYIIIRSTDLQNDKKSLRVGLVKENGVITSAYIGLSPSNTIHPEYLFYYLNMCDLKKVFYSLGGGLRQSLRFEEFKRFPVIVPPIEEQRLISRYLDKKTSQIDSLVEKIQKKIELLKEQRTSLINHYVTKGLDPNIEMKDSGVEWIGEIPKHWDCKKLKYISNITYGISPNETTYNDEGRGTVLINGPVEYSTTDFGYTRSIKWTTDPKNMVPKGSLLFCVRGSTTGRMNICHQDVSIGRGVCSIESKLDQDFTVFSMMMIRIYIQDQISGSTFPSVVKEDVDNFVLPCPPIEEQRSISKFLTKKIDVIDNLIDRHYQKKDQLIEYRQSLISSVVTGKVRVTEDMI